jgi:hypothetical protein
MVIRTIMMKITMVYSSGGGSSSSRGPRCRLWSLLLVIILTAFITTLFAVLYLWSTSKNPAVVSTTHCVPCQHHLIMVQREGGSSSSSSLSSSSSSFLRKMESLDDPIVTSAQAAREETVKAGSDEMKTPEEELKEVKSFEMSSVEAFSKDVDSIQQESSNHQISLKESSNEMGSSASHSSEINAVASETNISPQKSSNEVDILIPSSQITDPLGTPAADISVSLIVVEHPNVAEIPSKNIDTTLNNEVRMPIDDKISITAPPIVAEPVTTPPIVMDPYKISSMDWHLLFTKKSVVPLPVVSIRGEYASGTGFLRELFNRNCPTVVFKSDVKDTMDADSLYGMFLRFVFLLIICG